MFDTHIDYYRAVQCCMIENPPLAHSLSQQWQYQDCINESVVCKLIQASQLHGFTGKLSIGSHIGINLIGNPLSARNPGVSLHWFEIPPPSAVRGCLVMFLETLCWRLEKLLPLS